MNLRDLRYLVAVIELRHFGRAADACFVTQPTLSGQIRKLEEELGVALLERDSRTVVPTPVGETIARHARLALEQADAIVAAARSHRDPIAGPLRLGLIPTLAPYLMPLLLPALAARHPAMRLVVSEETTATLTARLRRHEIDAALVATDESGEDIADIRLFVEPFWVAMPRRHPLAEADTLSVRDLDVGEILLLSDGHCLADQVRGLCGTQPGARREGGDLRAASLETLLQLVGAGLGTTLVPALALRGSWTTGAGVIARPLSGSGAGRTVSLVYRRSFPRVAALEALADVIVAHLPNTVRCLRGAKAVAAAKRTAEVPTSAKRGPRSRARRPQGR